MRRTGLLVTLISVTFLVTGTICFAGSIAFHRSHGLSLQHWKSGYHHFTNTQEHKRHRFLKYHRLRRHKPKLSNVVLLGGYYGRSENEDNIRINLVLPPDKQDGNLQTTKEVREPLPPHIETLGEQNKQAGSSYKTIDYNKTGAHIVEYQTHQK